MPTRPTASTPTSPMTTRSLTAAEVALDVPRHEAVTPADPPATTDEGGDPFPTLF